MSHCDYKDQFEGTCSTFMNEYLILRQALKHIAVWDDSMFLCFSVFIHLWIPETLDEADKDKTLILSVAWLLR